MEKTTLALAIVARRVHPFDHWWAFFDKPIPKHVKNMEQTDRVLWVDSEVTWAAINYLAARIEGVDTD